MKKMRAMAKIAANHSGNAALCAILIMIMLLAVGTAALVVTGRQSINENQNMPAVVAVSSSEEEESSQATESVVEEPQPLVEYPERDMEFQRTDIEGLTARYTALLDCDNNTIYSGMNYAKKAYPASLTKIMTIVVALENCEDLSDTYEFTKADFKALEDQNASVAGFVAGEKVTVEDLLYGAMLESGADATLGIANYVAGSEEAFVELMNAKVEEMGLTGTHFVNASGLHDKEHYTTAIDMALIVQYALNNEDISEEFLKIISAERYTVDKTNKHEDGFTMSSIFFERYTDYFIDRDGDGEADAEIIGGKTGFTDESGYSLASIYRLDDTYFVCITIKSTDSTAATTDNIAVAERYLPVYDLLALYDDEESSSDSSDESSSAVDQAAPPIDQTESGIDLSSWLDSEDSEDTSTSSY